jgi:hypothetical protein
MAIVLDEPEADAAKNVVRFQAGKAVLGSPGWIRTSDHSINSRMLYR